MTVKKWYLSPIELYIIIQVRKIRLDLNITGKEISNFLDKNEKYIGHMESAGSKSRYNDETLNAIATYFTKRAKELREKSNLDDITSTIKTEYTIYDFYPLEILDDNRVLKLIPPIPLGIGPTGTLNALIESTNFFEVDRTLKDIVAKANEVQNQNWQASDFTQPLENVIKGRNKRLQLTLKNGLNCYSLIK